MIEDLPALTVARTIERPADDRLAALRDAPTGFLVDALGGRGGLDHRIKPLSGTPERLFGVALTCDAGPDDNLAVFGALSQAQPGDVVVIATGGWEGSAVIGDNVAGMLRNKGVTGVVTDGLVRDAAGIVRVGLPVFCRGVTPNSPARQGPGSAGLPVTLGGITIASGDVVSGDVDGVVIVPRARLDAVAARLSAIAAAEAEMEAQVAGGLTDPAWLGDVLAPDAVRWHDDG